MEWISVEDRMPKTQTGKMAFVDVLCWSESSLFKARYNPRTNNFLNDHFSNIQNVTHWMPLPEPPTQKRD